MVRDNAGRARQAVYFYYLAVAVCALSLVLNLAQLTDARRMLAAQNGTEVSLLDLVYFLTALAQVGAQILTYVFLIRWFRRAYLNVRLAGGTTEYTDGWAAGAWFVPFVNFVRPFSIMKEIWQETQRLAGLAVQDHSSIRIWWTFSVLFLLTSRIASRMTWQADTVAALENSLAAESLADIFALLTAAYTIMIIRRVADFEAQLQLQQKVQELGLPAPVVAPDEPDPLAAYQPA